MLELAASNQFGISDQTDVFAVDRNGTLHVAWVVDGGEWNGPVPISPPGLFPPGAAVTASNQFGISDQTDVFAVDRNGTLHVAWVVGGGGWNGPVAISPPGLFPPGAAVTASNQFGISDQTDVFAVDRNGTLHVAWVVGGGGWNGPVAISPPGLFPPGAAVTASNQFGISDQTDVFAVDRNGTLHVAWVVGGGGWNGPVAISPPGLFPPGAAVTASNQFGISDQTDVFAVDRNGTLHVAWVVGGGEWNGPVAISPPGLFPPDAAVTASNQFGISDQTDVFAVDRNGTLHVAWVVGGGGWNGPVAISPPGLFPPGAAVTASNQFGISDQTDVFAVDRNGTLHVAWVVGGGRWNGPVPMVTMAKLIDNGPFGSKITMVVVGDGFTIADQDTYNSHVDRLLTSGLFAHDFYAANKSAFNLVRLNVYSSQSGVSTKTYDASGKVTATTISNTYFGAIFNGDWNHCWVEDGPNTAERLNNLLNHWVPDRRLTFLLLNNPGFGGCGGGGRLTLPMGVDWSTVAHECGHALGGLADEYHAQNKAYTGSEPGEPNVTINKNRATLKWAWAVAASTPIPTGGDDYTPPKPAGWDDNQGVGLFEGGHGNFSTGIYRPVVNCRMNSNNPPFCPVCNGAMSAQTKPYLPAKPTGGAAVRQNTPGDGYMRMHIRLQNGNLSILEAHEVQGPLVQPEILTHGLVSEVTVDNERVAVGAHPEATISRSFQEPGHGPREHHFSVRDNVEFVVRVPISALHGVDPAKVTISVFELQEHPSTPLSPLKKLAAHPNLKLAPQSSVTLNRVQLPDKLGSLLQRK